MGNYYVQGSVQGLVVVVVVVAGRVVKAMLCLRASRDQKSSKNDSIILKFEIHKCLFPNESKKSPCEPF